jgi:hypothetical protein
MTAIRALWSRDRGLLALLIVLALVLPAVTARIYASDEIKYFAYLHSLSFDHDLDFTNDYQHWIDQGPKYANIKTLLKPNPDTGLPINEAPIGTAIFWAPAFLLAHVGVLLARALGARVAADGYSQPYISAVCYASYLYGWAGLLLAYRLARRWVEPFLGALATLTIWLGTSAVFYMVVAPPWSHAVSLFTVALFVTVWLRTRTPAGRSLRGWAALGLCAGLMMLVREQDALFLTLPAVEALFRLGRARGAGLAAALRGLAAGWALLLAVAFLTFIPQLITYRVTNGHFAPSSTVGEKLTWTSPHALDVLLSPAYGLLPWAPVALPALVGLALLARRDPELAVALLVAVAAQVFVAGAYSTWQGKSSFGQRRFINLTVILIVGLGVLLEWARGRGAPRVLLAACAALFVAWEGGLIIQYAALWGSAERQAGLQWPGVVADQLSLPGRLPDIARRFLFDRKSFYQGETGA